jgi:hypothetical protein
MMVVMALITTFMTTPLLEMIYPKGLVWSTAESVAGKQIPCTQLVLKATDSSAA